MGECFGNQRPRLLGNVPGERSEAWVETLAGAECPALTARRARRAEQSGLPQDPIVWKRALGANVEDVDGNVFVDLCAGFGVAAAGHSHPRICDAICEQSTSLVHALGDLHPSAQKIQLLRKLAELAPFDSARVILGLHGADAIEAALKTAMLATGKPGVLAFEGGYHGLHYGALAACGYQEAFRRPFQAQLNPHIAWSPFPRSEKEASVVLENVEQALRSGQPGSTSPAEIGAVLIEPIQGRGGVVVPPPGFLKDLQSLCRDAGCLLVLDEIYTGLGRCGAFLASTQEGITGDLVCIGKALGGGLPVSACLGPEDLMQAWGNPDGEAIHTATFFANPLGARSALRFLEIYQEEKLSQQANTLGAIATEDLEALRSKHSCIKEVRGRGMMLGIELNGKAQALKVCAQLLAQGYITLAAGNQAEVLQLSPPLNLPKHLWKAFVQTLDAVLIHHPTPR